MGWPCVSVSLSVVTNVPLLWGILITEAYACVGGKAYIRILCTFSLTLSWIKNYPKSLLNIHANILHFNSYLEWHYVLNKNNMKSWARQEKNGKGFIFQYLWWYFFLYLSNKDIVILRICPFIIGNWQLYFQPWA